MPLQATSGAASYDAFGGGVPSEPNYIESVFSCFLYTGNGSTQTITNGIDLSGKGGLVWIKSRSNAEFHRIFDTARGVNKSLSSNSTNAQNTAVNTVTAFNTTGFSLGDDSDGNGTNTNAYTYTSWTFRKQPKFFDVVTYTGNGGTPQNIAHSLGSVPGFIVVKPTSTTGGWICYHRSLTASGFNPAPYNTINLNSTGSILEDTGAWNSTAPTSTVFTIGSSPDVNTNGATYVAYLFAHNAGGFGLTGTDNVISCGSFTTSGTSDPNATVNLGYEPQWLMFKKTNVSTGITANWTVVDNMRGWPAGQNNGSGTSQVLQANTSSSEFPFAVAHPTATGFTMDTGNTAETYIYIAIRRGPMKVPTSGTSVFAPVNQAGGGTVTTNFPVDLNINTAKSLTIDKYAFSRLTGPANYLNTNLAAAETAGGANFILFDRQTSIEDDFWGSGNSIIYWNFRRAPSFFDEVCYTGNSTNPTAYNHNLTVVPELLIIKRRTGLSSWPVFYNFVGSTFDKLQGLNQDGVASTGQSYSGGAGLGGAPTTTTFTLDSTSTINGSGHNFVAYLFATCAGVSKVFSFTGNGSSQTINCGFTGGARFVLIKRTDSTGDWYVWDSARGIVSGNDPHLSLNTTAAEVTSDDTIDTDSTGFVVNQVSATNVNVSSATYIGLAIA